MAVCEKMMLSLPLLHWYVGVLLLAFIVQEWLRGGLEGGFWENTNAASDAHDSDGYGNRRRKKWQ